MINIVIKIKIPNSLLHVGRTERNVCKRKIFIWGIREEKEKMVKFLCGVDSVDTSGVSLPFWRSRKTPRTSWAMASNTEFSSLTSSAVRLLTPVILNVACLFICLHFFVRVAVGKGERERERERGGEKKGKYIIFPNIFIFKKWLKNPIFAHLMKTLGGAATDGEVPLHSQVVRPQCNFVERNLDDVIGI